MLDSNAWQPSSADFAPAPASQQQGQALVRPRQNGWQEFWGKFRRHRLGMLGLVLVVLITLAAIFGPMLTDISYSDQDFDNTYAAPFTVPGHPFGTDNLGRDMLVRILYGARISLGVGFAATAISVLIGVSYGAFAGYMGGWIDDVMMRIVEIVSAIPELLYVILLMTMMDKPGLTNVFIVLGVTGWLRMARVVRGEVLTLKEREFVLAARTIGTKTGTIMRKHLIPNAMGPILVTLTVGIPEAIFLESFLSFIGLGVSAPMSSWGTLASDGRALIADYPYMLLYPAAAIGITLLAFQFLGQGLRDVLDPRIQQ